MKRVTEKELKVIKPNTCNAFISLKEKTNLALVDVNREGIIGLNVSNTEITNLIVYIDEWLSKYYYTPLKNLEHKLEKLVSGRNQTSCTACTMF